jgi:hypothetical protein
MMGRQVQVECRENRAFFTDLPTPVTGRIPERYGEIEENALPVPLIAAEP